MKDFKKKAWIGLGGLTLLSGMWLTVMVLIGEDVYKASMVALVVLCSSLFFIAALYAKHTWLRWGSWVTTLILLIMQIFQIFSNYDYEKRPLFAQFVDNALGAAWLTAITFVALVLFSMAYRFVKHLKLAKTGYWITVVLTLIGSTLNSITIYTEMASDSYNSDPPLIRYASAAYIMAIFIGLIIIVYAIAERRKEAAIEQASIDQVSQLMTQGNAFDPQNLIGGNMVGGKSVIPVDSGSEENSYINPQMEEAFLHFVKLYEEGKISVNYESRARSAEVSNSDVSKEVTTIVEAQPELIAEPLSMVSEEPIEEVVVEDLNEEVIAASAEVSSRSDLKYSEPEDLDDTSQTASEDSSETDELSTVTSSTEIVTYNQAYVDALSENDANDLDDSDLR